MIDVLPPSFSSIVDTNYIGPLSTFDSGCSSSLDTNCVVTLSMFDSASKGVLNDNESINIFLQYNEQIL